MRTYTHTLEMDTCSQGYPTIVQAVFKADDPIGIDPEIKGLLGLLSTPEPLNDEDMTHLFEWLLEDKDEWKVV